MSRRGRLLLFGCAGSGLLAVLVIGLHGLPPFGGFHGAYGLLVDRLEPGRRHATDIVTALNFDLRAFDTLGEEFILFASVTAVALLPRHLRDEDDEPPRRSLDDHRFAGASDALRVLSLILIPLLVSLGVYLALHGALTPGGGFQAGVVLAAGPLAILLAGRYLALKRVAPQWALEALDGIGALGWLLAVFAIVSALTAGAVLRVAGRVFYGWGPSEGPDSRQARAAHERVDETREDRGRTPPLMLVVPGVLLAAGVVGGLVPGAVAWVARSAARFADHPAYAQWVLHGHSVRWPPGPPTHVETIDVIIGMLTLVAAFGVAAAGLFGRPLLVRLPRRVRAGGRGAVMGLRGLHSGHVGDYIAWWTTGAGLLGGACLLALR